ncbi:Sec-C motif domain protein [Bizionia gelidisalsuginis]|uniref:Sec-C motif domain protein n=1 Tax=Bizionia gelidisalsuginis TaxID=291188 RepID=A0ABY3M7S7_9FLAO|nr:YchJ family metal-binding protein [Bizionia gelidisalsuginis]TYC09236.1 Sec-C motif domain protein [Bizionia gelidisalsuginis]
MNCYCGTNKPYESCCEIFHLNGGQTETAEQLMRSRYSAFVLANGDYLMQTHHESTRPTKEKEAIVNWAKSVQWIKLEILETTKDTVEFNAHFSKKGKADCIYENSKFIKENTLWYYLGYAENTY